MLQREGRRELSEYLGNGTNNIAELTGILRAAEAVEDPARPFRLYTDSSYAIGVLTKGWKVKANVELVAAVKKALARLEDVSLHHVRGHAGVPLNERADALAVEAVETRASSGWREVEG
jgi:ribonuclease HI